MPPRPAAAKSPRSRKAPVGTGEPQVGHTTQAFMQHAARAHIIDYPPYCNVDFQRDDGHLLGQKLYGFDDEARRRAGRHRAARHWRRHHPCRRTATHVAQASRGAAGPVGTRRGVGALGAGGNHRMLVHCEAAPAKPTAAATPPHPAGLRRCGCPPVSRLSPANGWLTPLPRTLSSLRPTTGLPSCWRQLRPLRRPQRPRQALQPLQPLRPLQPWQPRSRQAAALQPPPLLLLLPQPLQR